MEILNVKLLEVALSTGKKIIISKVIILVLVVDSMPFTQQYFFLPITNLIIFWSDFLDKCFTVLNVGDCTITLHCTDYMLTTRLTGDPVYNKNLEKIVMPTTTKVLYK